MASVDELKQRIIDDCNSVKAESISLAVRDNWQEGACLCISNGGGHFEHDLDILPVLLEDVPLQRRLDMYFQQDGCPAHNARVVRGYLDRNFHEKCLGTHCPIQWPPRSLELTPMDYLLWGCLKNKVYINLNPVASVDNLKRRITLACLDLDFATISAATSKAWGSRVLACLSVGCAQFE
uniref:Uncharacterized protein n=1 Tax=Rhodnius prolixus TaxID=13249 RepID=T1I2L1_RHOPR